MKTHKNCELQKTEVKKKLRKKTIITTIAHQQFSKTANYSLTIAQGVQNAAARLITGIGYHEHITPVLQSLHWLPMSFRITCKLCALIHLVHIGCSPAYLTEVFAETSELPSRHDLRSASSRQFEVPRTILKYGERTFSFAGPADWNAPDLYVIYRTKIGLFKKKLKTYLFSIAVLVSRTRETVTVF